MFVLGGFLGGVVFVCCWFVVCRVVVFYMCGLFRIWVFGVVVF